MTEANPPSRPLDVDSTAVNWKLTGVLVALTAIALFVLDPRSVFAITEVMIFVLFASALNLVLSYSGMVSFGHGVYFGLGAYGIALTVARFDWPIWAGLMAGPVLATIAGLVYGFLSVQLTFIYAGMLTLACAEVTFGIAHQWFSFTGGESGITGYVVTRLGLSPEMFGLTVLIVVTVSLLLLWRIVHSPLGLVIRAVGENPMRAGAMGHNRKTIQLIAFTISGFFSGVAGTLYGVFHGNVFPDYVGAQFTLDGLVMVLLGGLYSFSAGIYGAVIFKLADNIVSHYFELWELVIGIILMSVIILSPAGIAGYVNRLLEHLRRRTHA
ncbi:MAG: branched-chain amino acid ABC transporter permease [Candidatus Lambdaproteobacteria bacterium]|nr:branched-chain amino acid ABC transporter permease [Candidatus Lambdaproteobacteria bacterium]